jgi:predicted CXXCH cytochrome family protein
MRNAALVVCLLASAALAGLLAAQQAADGFPHQRHARLFPVCESCHAGILSPGTAAVYPEPASCQSCHDGERRARVRWSGASRRSTTLHFSHVRHMAEVSARGGTAGCQACHATEAATDRMAVDRAAPERCIGCHEHRAESHLAASVACGRCHVPLGAAAGIAATRIARFPRPPWHSAPDFAASHGVAAAQATASCAVCHARETCERCHANAQQLPVIASLASDARVAVLEAGRAPAYPVPASHGPAAWHLEHGASARSDAAACANCHTRPSCTGCHIGGAGTAAAAVQSLPAAVPGRAPGVDPERIRRSVHEPDIAQRHGGMAASGRLECAQCHGREQCAACHAAADSRSFHPANFLERHAVDVFTGRGRCQDCHRAETFCRACHAAAGFAAQDMKAAFHDAQPMWLLSHGRAARLGLEACASCHRQGDCVQCHAASGGWGVNPHGAGFTGSGASRSSAGCRLCHTVRPRSDD